MSVRTNRILRLVAVIILALVILVPGGCVKRRRTENEQIVIDRLRPFWGPLEDYKRQSFTYPEHFFDLCTITGIPRPINPYTNLPMEELESKEFERNVSPGNIYYTRVRDSDGQIINCQVVIFGERGIITTYHHSSPASAL